MKSFRVATVFVVVLISTCLLRAQNPLTNGLVAYFPFDGNANDQTASGYDGTVHGAQPTSNRFGNLVSAYHFNGSSDYIVVGELLPDSQQFTVSAWIRSEEDKVADIFYDAAFFTPGRDTVFEVLPGGTLRALFTKISDPGPNPLDVAGILTTGVWTHVVAMAGPNGSRIYVNGLPVGSSTNAGNNVGYHSTPYIGAANHGSSVEYFFRGSIDDLRIYNRALSDTDVQELYASESFCSPHRAEATAVVTNGFVVGATLTDTGCGYTNAPLVLILDGGGSNATATATVSNGVVVAVNIISAGCCYTNIPRIEIASPPFVPTLSIRVSKVKVTQHVVLGRNYVLESSTDLTNWTPVGPPFTATSENITDEFDVDQTGRFFRIRQVP